MAVDVAWDNEEHSIVRWEFQGRWSWDEFYDAVSASKGLVQSVSHRVDVIFDARKSAALPENFFTHFRQGEQARSDNSGAFVIVGGGMLVKAAVRMFQQVFGPWLHNEVLLADTLEDAYSQITAQREIA